MLYGQLSYLQMTKTHNVYSLFTFTRVVRAHVSRAYVSIDGRIIHWAKVGNVSRDSEVLGAPTAVSGRGPFFLMILINS